MQIIINLIIFLITLFLYIHINFHLKTNNDLEIFDVDEITKDQLEEICDYKQPMLFKFYVEEIYNNLNLDNIIKNYKTFDVSIRNLGEYTNQDSNIVPITLRDADELFMKDASATYISEYNKDFVQETTLLRYIEANDLFLRPHLCSECQYDIIFGSVNSYTPLRYELNARNYLYVVDGEIELMLTVPNNYKHLDVIRDYDIFEFRSKLNPFRDEDKEKLERVKFLTVTLKPGDIVFIPYKWFYTFKVLKSKTIVCSHKYKVAMNTLAIVPDLFYKFLYDQNIKFNFLNTIS